MSEIVNLNKEHGMCVVFHYKLGTIQDFANNPKVVFIDMSDTEVTQFTGLTPSNTRIIIHTPGGSGVQQGWINSFCRTKNVPWLVRRTKSEVEEALKKIFPPESKSKPSVEEVIETQKKGRLNDLIENIDWNLSNAENARELIKIANKKNITTTVASLAQFVSNKRREKGGTAIPKSVRPKLDLSVEILDNMIKELTDMRDFLIETVEENRIMRAKLEKFSKAFEELK